jgi:hypothetical protein
MWNLTFGLWRQNTRATKPSAKHHENVDDQKHATNYSTIALDLDLDNSRWRQLFFWPPNYNRKWAWRILILLCPPRVICLTPVDAQWSHIELLAFDFNPGHWNPIADLQIKPRCVKIQHPTLKSNPEPSNPKPDLEIEPQIFKSNSRP